MYLSFIFRKNPTGHFNKIYWQWVALRPDHPRARCGLEICSSTTEHATRAGAVADLRLFKKLIKEHLCPSKS
jgi:hypothetical protein